MKTLFLLLILSALPATASFQQGYRSPQDLMISLQLVFQDRIERKCDFLDRNNSAAFGDQNLMSGEPLSEMPDVAFREVWRDCIQTYLYSALGYWGDDQARGDANAAKTLRVFFAPVQNQIEKLKKSFPGAGSRSVLLSLRLEAQDKETLIADWMFRFLGTDEEIQSFGRLNNPAQYRKELLQKVSTMNNQDFFMQVMFELLSRDEFLLYY